MKRLLLLFVMLSTILVQMSCDKYADDYKNYLDNKEIVYPGQARNLRYYAGHFRTKLVWNPSPDPNIAYYIVSWENGNKSVQVAASTHNPVDSIQVVIPDLTEYVYSFSIRAYDRDGNASIGQQIQNVRVYGTNFQSLLLNRSPNRQNPYSINEDNKVLLHFNAPDTLNVVTEISYSDNAGKEKTVRLSQKQNSIELPDFRFGSSVSYKSGYLAEDNGIDTIFVLASEVYPQIRRSIAIDKTKFHEFNLPNDAGPDWGWVITNLWDNNFGEPGYHTPGRDLPLSFTLDMGEQYELSRLKIWQRLSGLYNYGNPKRFEVWGSNNPSSDGSWGSWTKLADFMTRKPSGLPTGSVSDEDRKVAEQGDDYTFPNEIQAFRYLRFKVLETWGGTNYVHILEITPFRKE
ncbi:MAG: hypothetical protein K0S24_256 [Sphingobacterium sp.]|jgi:hypothetical protein|nr:hypothetical protein [Sphingobacterium sp.]